MPRATTLLTVTCIPTPPPNDEAHLPGPALRPRSGCMVVASRRRPRPHVQREPRYERLPVFRPPVCTEGRRDRPVGRATRAVVAAGGAGPGADVWAGTRAAR